jgi:predicted Ser/Thr protein kinase
MDDAARRLAEELFDLAAELPRAQWDTFLDARCGPDGPLRAEVESLLANVREDSFLQTPAYGVATVPREIPERIGRYRVLRLIGEGGMGTVYEAEQEDPKRTVALKVMRGGWMSPALLHRFRREAQVLGQLQHPAIAQVYEAGTIEIAGGMWCPYFAMELVRGRPLDEHARAHDLSVRERLALVALLCEAVHYAHERGVIHRDLKPTNILVDEGGRPRVLDFGVARATGSDLRAETLHTEAGQVVGTLSYMSPELISGRPDGLDARSDVYALGVILYQVLAGWLPHDLAGKSLPVAGRVILEEEPPALGAANPQCRGDVEIIAAKAMAKEKERRYASAAELAADLRRCLADEPIAARPASTFYQLRKFARRNKSLVGVVAAALVVLLCALVAVSALALRFQGEKVRAQETLAFLESVMTAANPYCTVAGGRRPRHLGANARLVDVLDELVSHVDLFRDPVAEASIRQKMAAGYVGIGRYADGVREAGRALTLLHGCDGQEDLCLEAQKALAFGLNFLGDAQEAVRLAADVVLRCEQIHGDGSLETLNALCCLHLCLNYAGYVEDSRATLERVLASTRNGAPSVAYVRLLAKAELARVLIRLHRPEEGEALAREALAEGEAAGARQTHAMALAHFSFARAAAQRGRFAEAEARCRDGLALWTELAGETPALEFRVLLGAYIRRQPGREDEGLAVFRDAVAARSEQVGPDDPVTAWLIRMYAGSLAEASRLEESEARFRDYFEIVQRSAIPESHSRAWDCWCFARLLLSRGKIADAEAWLREGLQVAALFTREQWVRHWWDDRLLLVDLARLLESRGCAGEAEQFYGLVRARLGERGDPAQADLVARGLHEAGRHAEAEAVARLAVDGFRAVQDQVGNDFASALDTWAAAVRALGRLEDAERARGEAEAARSAGPEGGKETGAAKE